ncbi:MAG: hypothetical protein SGPRY_005573 [Prymnesium sp.]
MVVGPVTPAPGVSKRLSQALESEPKYDQLLFHQGDLGVSARRGCVKWRTAGGRAMLLVLPDARVPEYSLSITIASEPMWSFLDESKLSELTAAFAGLLSVNLTASTAVRSFTSLGVLILVQVRE